MVERFNGTLAREWAYVRECSSEEDRRVTEELHPGRHQRSAVPGIAFALGQKYALNSW
jgi:hypothetical protein